MTEALRQAAASAEVVGLHEVVGGEWDRLSFVCPYEDDAVVTKRLGFVWQDSPGSLAYEGQSAFVFSREDSVVAWAQVSRADGDPCGPGSRTPMSLDRSDAAFRVVSTGETGGGSAFYSLQHQPGRS